MKNYKLKTLSLMAFAFGLMHQVSAQVDPNAYGYYNYVPTFSQQTVFGTARTQGLAGAGVSLGGDIGYLGVNSASLGLIKKSEMTISAAVGSSSVNSTFNGSSMSDNKVWVGIPNFGIVYSFPKEDFVPGLFRGGSFGISFTKTNNFQENSSYAGVNSKNTMPEYFADAAQGSDYNSIQNDIDNNGQPTSVPSLAWNSFLIDYTNNNVYARNVDFTYTSSQQRQSIRTKAGQYTWNLAYGANINDKVFLGIGGSMVITNYKNEKKYEEIIAPGTDVIKNFSYYENDYQRGTGFNANVGLIVKPTDFLRLGASFQTPTINYMRETYNYRIETNFNNYFYVPGSGNGFTVTQTDLSTPTFNYNYRYINPLKISGGASLIFGKLGLVTADIEYVPYTNASFKERVNSFALQGDNATVKNIYKDVINYKLGAEIRLADIYRIRGGFAYNASPYKTETIDRSTMYFTGGVGMRLTDYYIDFTVVQGRTSQIYQPYTVQSGNSPEVTQKKNYGLYQITTGIYF